MSANGWATVLIFLPPAILLFTIFVALPMAEAALVRLLQLERLRPAGEVHRPQELRLPDRQRDVPARARQQRPHHRRLAPRPTAACARRRDDGRRPDRRRGVVPDDLLSALCARRCRRGADLALHVRRRLRPRGRGHRRARPPAVLSARGQELGVLRHPDRRHLEILRLPHDAVRRGLAGHRQVAARGGRDRRRQRVAALLATSPCRCSGR